MEKAFAVKQGINMNFTKKAVIAAAPAILVGVAYAGTAGTAFAASVTWLQSELNGSLGMLLTLAALAVGLGVGVMQQSVVAVVTGIAFAIAVQYGPGILVGMITASAGIA